MKKIVIVVDMQNDFIDGVLGSKEAVAIVNPMADYLTKVSCEPDVRIVATRDTHDEATYMQSQEGKFLPVMHCGKGTKGWAINDKLAGFIPEENIINKPNFGLTQKAWKEFLGNEISEITLLGVCTDICVVSNALALKSLYPETPISVIGNLCAGVTPTKHEAALETMRSCQINVVSI